MGVPEDEGISGGLLDCGRGAAGAGACNCREGIGSALGGGVPLNIPIEVRQIMCVPPEVL